ncbi:flippase [Methanobacterium alcaliphilum]|uniref:flippase n=1 Tax=Methanobacterium alcaliphilum TaxID=392018 RepID=UPI00200B54A1|nr:flippase [Methanobacterium alcaliphilum]MCK9150777.1 flippase [Methanobacterium alcaliphilum]
MISFKKFLKDIGISGVAHISNTGKNIILLPVLTKTLGAEPYGIWAQMLVTVTILMPLALLQLEYSMTRFLSAEKNQKKLRKGVYSIIIAMMISAVAFSLFIFIFANPIASSLFGGIKNTIFVQITALILFLTTLDQIIFRYFISFDQIKKYSMLLLSQNIFEIIIVSFTVLNGYGLLGAFLSLVLIRLGIFLIGVPIIKSQVSITTPSFSLLKHYIKFSLPLIPFNLSMMIMSSGDRYIIGYYLDPSAVGIYSASYILGSVLSFLYAPISTVFFPTITRLFENKDDAMQKYLTFTFKLFLMIGLPALFGIAVLSKQLLSILTTSIFVGSFIIVSIIAIGDLFFNLSNMFSNILMLFKKNNLIAFSYIISAIINITLNIYLVSLIGIIGAALSSVITYIILFSIISFFSFREIKFEWDPLFIVKCIISSSIMALVIYYLGLSGLMGILFSILLGIGIYFGFLILLKGISKNEYYLIKNIVSKKR